MEEKKAKRAKVSFKVPRYWWAAFSLLTLLAIFIFSVQDAQAWNPFKDAYEYVTDQVSNTFYSAINTLLYAVWTITAMLLVVGAVIFDWAVKPEIFEAVVRNNTAIMEGWIMVRDFLNMFFILVLLFSAFCTIFQIDKYNLKKVLLMVILMALLVNFSFPIARFIIDIANITMYFFFNNIFPNGNTNGMSITAVIAKYNFVNQFNPYDKTDNLAWGSSAYTVKIIGAIIFTFIFAATLIILGLLLVIRMVVLAVLIIFSPVGFVGAIMPGFSKFSSQWWDNLLKHAFFGPLMAFMILLAIRMYVATNQYINTSLANTIKSNTANMGYMNLLIAQGATTAVFIAILWVGMMTAQRMGISGAAFAYKAGMSFSKKISGVNFAKRTYGAYQARRKEADTHSLANRLGRGAGSFQDKMRGKIPGKQGQYAALRYQRDQMQKVQEAAKLNDTEHQSEAELQKLASSSDKFERAAGIMELASRKLADGSQLNEVRQIFGADGQVARNLEDKMIGYAGHAVARDVNGNYDATRVVEAARAGKIKPEDLSADAIEDHDFMRTMMENKFVTGANLEKLRGKSEDHKIAVQDTTRHMANMKDSSGNFVYSDMNNEAHRNIQIAMIAQTGDRSDLIKNDLNAMRRVFEYSNHETLKRSNAWLAESANAAILGDVKGSNQLAKIATELEKGSVAHNLAEKYRGPGALNGGKHRDYFEQNNSVKNL